MAGSDIRILLEYNPCCSAPLKKGGLAEPGLLTCGSIYVFRIIREKINQNAPLPARKNGGKRHPVAQKSTYIFFNSYNNACASRGESASGSSFAIASLSRSARRSLGGVWGCGAKSGC